MPRCAAAVVLADTAIAILASLAVLPAYHAAGGGGEGAMMLFVTMQVVFDAYGAWGGMFGFLFYLLVLLADKKRGIALQTPEKLHPMLKQVFDGMPEDGGEEE